MVIMYFEVTLLILLVLFLKPGQFQEKFLITRMAQSEAYSLLYREWHMVDLVMSCAENLDGTSAQFMLQCRVFIA